MKKTKNTEKTKSTKKVKKQEYRSLWTTVFDKGMNESAFPAEVIDKAIKDLENNKIDFSKPVPEIERLLKIFRPKN